MVESRKWVLPLFASVMAFVIAVPVALKDPLYAVIVTSVSLLLIVSSVSNIDLPRGLAVVFLPALTAFNVLNTKIGIAITCGLICLYGIKYLANKEYRLDKGTGIGLVFFLGWFSYTAFQMLYVEHTARTWTHIQTLLFGVVTVFLMARIINSGKWLETLYRWWGVAVLSTVAVGFWEITTGNHLPNSGATLYQLNNVATVGFFNPNDYSFFLLISLPVMFHWIKQSALYKALGMTMMLSSFYFMYLGGARFLIMLYFVSIGVFLISLVNKRRKLLFSFLIAMAVAAFSYWDFILEAVQGITTLGGSDASTIIRRDLAKSAWHILQSHPFGVGPGNLEYYMDNGSLYVHGISNVHNFWLEILVNYGVIVCIGLSLFFAMSIYKMFKANNAFPAITPVLWSSVIFIPACLESSSVFTFNITWFLFATITCALNIIKQERPSL